MSSGSNSLVSACFSHDNDCFIISLNISEKTESWIALKYNKWQKELSCGAVGTCTPLPTTNKYSGKVEHLLPITTHPARQKIYPNTLQLTDRETQDDQRGTWKTGSLFSQTQGFRENRHTRCFTPKIRRKMHTWWISEGMNREGPVVKNISIKDKGQKTSILEDNRKCKFWGK